jgi:hypothetical protein
VVVLTSGLQSVHGFDWEPLLLPAPTLPPPSTAAAPVPVLPTQPPVRDGRVRMISDGVRTRMCESPVGAGSTPATLSALPADETDTAVVAHVTPVADTVTTAASKAAQVDETAVGEGRGSDWLLTRLAVVVATLTASPSMTGVDDDSSRLSLGEPAASESSASASDSMASASQPHDGRR